MNEERIKTSIIVPIYGIEDYLPQCIDSILGQTYTNIEIILVDDGAKDNCPAICDGYATKDDRIIVIHKPNGGLVSARKAGIGKATGDYICNVDGDDWIHPDYVKSFVEIIEQYAPDIVCSGEITSYPDHIVLKPMREREGFYDREAIVKEILPSLLERKDGYYINHGNQQKCIRKGLAVLSLSTVNNDISMSEDHACISVAMSKANSLYVSKDCLYYYRIAPQSMTNVKKPLPWTYPLNMSNHFRAHVDLSIADLENQYYRVMSHILFNTVISQFYSGRSYFEVCKDINTHLNEYKDVLNRACFSKLSRVIVLFSLRYRIYPFFKLCSIIKKRRA